MRIGVISDTHDNIPNIKKAIRLFRRKKVSFVIHCGDIVAPKTVELFKGLNMIFVQGNCDGDVEGLKTKISEIGGKFFIGGFGEMELAGKRFALAHRPTVVETILGAKYDFIIHGYTHQRKVEKINRVVVINPGSHYLGDLKKENCVVIIDLHKNLVDVIKI